MKTILHYTVLADPTSSFLTVDLVKDLGKLSHTAHDNIFSKWVSESADTAFRDSGYPQGNYILQTPYYKYEGDAICYEIAEFPVTGAFVSSASVVLTDWTLDVEEGRSYLTFTNNPQVTDFRVSFTSSMAEDFQTTLKRADQIISHYRNFGASTTQLYPNPFAKYGKVNLKI
jgi:hypothetical protein